MYLIRKGKEVSEGSAFVIYAHRGASQLAPENTIAALLAASAAGATRIEFDVRLTKNGVPVIFHDGSLKRTTNGQGYLSQVDYDTLSHLDAGSWFDSSFADQRVPTLAAWLQCAASLGLSLNLEMKVVSYQQAQLLAQLVVQQLKQFWPDHLDKPLISSSSLYALQCVSQASKSTWPLALISDKKLSNEQLTNLSKVRFFSVHHYYKSVDKDYVAACHQKGLKVLAYTVNDGDMAKDLQQNGVDGIFTDNDALYRLAK